METLYKVLPVDELRKIEDTKASQITKEFVVDYNGVAATVFKDGTAILTPPVFGEKEGLLFYSIEEMDKMIQDGEFPVKGNGSFWQREKERVLQFSTHIEYYCSELATILDYKIELIEDAAYLKELSTLVNKKLKVRADRRNLYHYFSIYIGELLRQKVNGVWELLPQPAFNVYYIPEIIKGNEFCNHWGLVEGQFEMATFIPVDTEKLLKEINVFAPIGERKYLKEK